MTASANGAAGISYMHEFRRKLIHLSSLWMVAAMLLLPRWPLAAAFGVCFVLNVLLERAYVLKVPYLTGIYRFFFGRMLRREPRPDQWIVSGGPYVWASAAMSLVLFPSVIAAAALAVMLIADTAAALVGRRWGRHKTVNGKSIEGVAAFLVAGWAVIAVPGLFAAMPWTACLAGMAGVIAAAFAELFEKQIRLDDNFSIPLIVGGFLLLG